MNDAPRPDRRLGWLDSIALCWILLVWGMALSAYALSIAAESL